MSTTTGHLIEAADGDSHAEAGEGAQGADVRSYAGIAQGSVQLARGPSGELPGPLRKHSWGARMTADALLRPGPLLSESPAVRSGQFVRSKNVRRHR